MVCIWCLGVVMVWIWCLGVVMVCIRVSRGGYGVYMGV